eukprot:NODE_831_length_1425_cov_90.010174_g689_i0.p1 GENE.NODE_831_length_1425_cov_90.010174_g689_i0~~NODE_831_length_1425_cov_90.010174_g689_i0.p1  ORF type:complete len:365 (+),score=71.55 NODE_831_length_1425_cov_90.010174_g689_i0:251-1345(+)
MRCSCQLAPTQERSRSGLMAMVTSNTQMEMCSREQCHTVAATEKDFSRKEMVYFGTFEDGLRSGHGTLIYRRREYVGEWKNDIPHGYGTESTVGNVSSPELYKRYKGMWHEGEPHGEGVLEFHQRDTIISFEGQFQRGHPKGQGFVRTVHRRTHEQETKSVVLEFGGTYEGERNNAGVPHGAGKLKSFNNILFEGTFVHGFLCGEGRITWPGGSYYVGGVHKFRREGFGTMTFVSGAYYKGEWKNNEKHGHAESTEKSSIYIGQFEDGVWCGHGRLEMAGKNPYKYEGEFKDHLFHGAGKLSSNDVIVYDGIWNNGHVSTGSEKDDVSLMKRLMKSGFRTGVAGKREKGMAEKSNQLHRELSGS